ncbi:hypothetical protein BXZ70DRAFT_919402 [Cristinia sonorae]|uniref:Uncharacterized protein n=1 Tax=Cristinia sonorae TaxID=1940300 RepID=A0A8K0XT90_9AGAR|nr:hypothetical protein BXZ70DRAFT_919402 [Cristinia sonorae]
MAHEKRIPTPQKTKKSTNDIPLTSEYLLVVLSDLSTRIARYFGSMAPVNLVVHGGVVMVLHEGLKTRPYTLDIDYCHRGFVVEWANRGLCDADARLKKCIAETAERFDLGPDWMNAHADTALPHRPPLEKAPQTYDHVWHAAMEKQNMEDNTIYRSDYLRLIAVPWSWGVALKLQRYLKFDPYDIACILNRGKTIRAVRHWDLRTIEVWLRQQCSALGYDWFSAEQIYIMRERMQHAICFAQKIEAEGKAQLMTLQQQSQQQYFFSQKPQHAGTSFTNVVRVR